MNLTQLDRIILKNIQWPNDFSEKRFCLWDISRKYNYSIVTVKNRWEAMVSSGFIVSLKVKPNNELFGLRRGLVALKNKHSMIKEEEEFLKRNKYITNTYSLENEEIGIDFLYPSNLDPLEFINKQLEYKFKFNESSYVAIDNNLRCHITRKDLLILRELINQPLLNAKELSSILGIKRTIVAKSLDKMSEGNAFSVDPILNISCVENLIFAIYHAYVKEGSEQKITRDICFSLKDNYLLTKYFIPGRVLILASFNNNEEVESFKQQMSSFDVTKQSLNTIFKTNPQKYFIYEQLLNELIEKHSRNGLNNESNEFSEEEVIQNKKLGKADDV